MPFLLLYFKEITMKKESEFQSGLIKDIEKRLPGCFIEKADPNYRQGTPDLRVYYKDRWAALEVKRSAKEVHQPNQDFYVEQLNKMSFARFIYPENKEEVLDEMERALSSKRSPRNNRSK